MEKIGIRAEDTWKSASRPSMDDMKLALTEEDTREKAKTFRRSSVPRSLRWGGRILGPAW